jgi:hypothetical protein
VLRCFTVPTPPCCGGNWGTVVRTLRAHGQPVAYGP